jgi:hypothetical protein
MSTIASIATDVAHQHLAKEQFMLQRRELTHATTTTTVTIN